MTSLPGEDADRSDQPDTPEHASHFTGPTPEMKRRARITGMLFFALFLVFLSFSLWRKLSS